MRRFVKSARVLSIVLLAPFLAACAQIAEMDFPITREKQADLNLENVEIIRLTPENITSYAAARRVRSSRQGLHFAARSWKYRVGVGDVLSITVWDHPELTVPGADAATQTSAGIPVRADGSIFYPYIGEVFVTSRDVADIQQEISSRLAEFIPDPQVAVQVTAFNSQKVVISGEVERPGTLPVTNIPLTLVEAVTASGGLSPNANGQEVRITRGERTYYLNLEDFLRNGRAQNNPLLQGGDVVFIPDLGNNVAYVLGQVKDPGTADLGQDGLSLTDAISAKGGLDNRRANARGIFVFRAIGEGKFRVFQLDATTPLSLALATRFMLHPQDVVYVVTDPVAKWNDAISNLLPSITALNATLALAN